MAAWLRTIVYQGIFGIPNATRLMLDGGASSLEPPEGASPEAWRTMIFCILFPADVSAEPLQHFATGQPGDVRMGAALCVPDSSGREHHFQLTRRLGADSVSLRRKIPGGLGEEIAQGATAVSEYLSGTQGLIPLRDFMMLHAWDFSDFLQHAAFPDAGSSSAQASSGPEAQALIAQWRKASQAEALDLEIDAARFEDKEAQRKLAQIEKLHGQQEGREARLASLEQVLGLSDAQWDLVAHYEDRCADLDRRKSNLEAEVEEAREDRQEAMPGALHKDKLLMGGVVASVLCFGVSLFIMRPIALANIVFLGLVAWALLKRFEHLEGASVYDLRAEQIYRHLEEVARERSTLEREHGLMLARVGADDLDALRNMVEERDLLRETLSAPQKGGGDDEELARRYRKVKKKAAAARQALDSLTSARASLGELDRAGYELESALYDMGVDVQTLSMEEPEVNTVLGLQHEASAGPVRHPLDLFFAVREAAARNGYLPGGQLSPKCTELWRRFAKHLLGKAFAEIKMDAAGRLCLEHNADQALETWARRSPAQIPVLAACLSAAILTTAPSAATHPARAVLLLSLDWDASMSQGRLPKVLDYLGKYLQVVSLGAP